jgi:hypothetical protein
MHVLQRTALLALLMERASFVARHGSQLRVDASALDQAYLWPHVGQLPAHVSPQHLAAYAPPHNTRAHSPGHANVSGAYASPVLPARQLAHHAVAYSPPQRHTYSSHATPARMVGPYTSPQHVRGFPQAHEYQEAAHVPPNPKELYAHRSAYMAALDMSFTLPSSLQHVPSHAPGVYASPLQPAPSTSLIADATAEVEMLQVSSCSQQLVST